MRNILEDIELDIKELKFLVEFVSSQPALAHIAKRRIREVKKRLDQLQKELDDIPNAQSAPLLIQNDKEIEEQNVVEQKAVVIEEKNLMAEPLIHTLHKPGEHEVVNDTASGSVLGERLKPAAELSKSFSLNDTFRFSRELFDGDTDRMNAVLSEIAKMSSFAEVMLYLEGEITIGEENAAMEDFIELLRKYFL